MPTLDYSTKETELPPGTLYRGKDLSGSLAGPYRLISRIGIRGAAECIGQNLPKQWLPSDPKDCRHSPHPCQHCSTVRSGETTIRPSIIRI